MSSWLRDHLVGDHGRALHELGGLPLAAVHRWEHIEQSLGLLSLDHVHEGEDPTVVISCPEPA